MLDRIELRAAAREVVTAIVRQKVRDDEALDKLPVESPTIELTQRLVEEIGAALAGGIRDEDELAAAALERSNLRPDL